MSVIGKRIAVTLIASSGHTIHTHRTEYRTRTLLYWAFCDRSRL